MAYDTDSITRPHALCMVQSTRVDCLFTYPTVLSRKVPLLMHAFAHVYSTLTVLFLLLEHNSLSQTCIHNLPLLFLCSKTAQPTDCRAVCGATHPACGCWDFLVVGCFFPATPTTLLHTCPRAVYTQRSVQPVGLTSPLRLTVWSVPDAWP